ncbi:hypothetical protein QAD02_019299 [Eretmocerus hayati]|uniref:Uncharacterized protein n=1 Tax=Eretmocerus hayati TaxID=131215 RepID=A0ACC2PJ76_9HYME|nr:hypothetical protein QAD02_019299 [Eretmocerus hayati]
MEDHTKVKDKEDDEEEHNNLSPSQQRTEYFEKLENWLIEAYGWYSFISIFPYLAASSHIINAPHHQATPNNTTQVHNSATSNSEQTADNRLHQRRVPGQPSPPTAAQFQERQTTGTIYRIPPIWKRFLAEVIDSLLLFVLKPTITYIAVDYFDFIDVEQYYLDIIKSNLKFDYKMLLDLTSGILVLELIHKIFVCMYEVAWLQHGRNGRVGGATPGKSLMGIRVIQCHSIQSVGRPDEELVLVNSGTDLGLLPAIMRSVLKNVVLGFMLPFSFALCFFRFNRTGYDLVCNSGDVQSMFGYSVAEYRDVDHRGWVVIGAPMNQPGKGNIGGAVFRCDIAEDNRCFPIEFDKNGTNYVRPNKIASPGRLPLPEPIDDKSKQWFGATISASMTDGGPIVACAPKYNWFGYIKATKSVDGRRDVVGSCWWTSLSNNSPIEFSPCRNNDTAGHHRQGMCQAGIGAAITKDGKRIFVGSPGSFYWQGQLFTVESNVILPWVPDRNPHTVGQTTFLATKEGPPSEDSSFLGYSVAVGDFLGDGDSGVAVGVPRALDLSGKVLLFTSQLRNHHNISGEQMGAYFGYALAVNDVNGDDLDDLIVSAPFYTQPDLSGVKIETGRVYIFYQKNGFKTENFDVLDGDSNRGQFGLSLASLGDIDLDGYGDFAVGEPYGGQEQRGAVYIYHGTKEGVEQKYSQVIYSENLEQPVRTFGWSLSGGLDLDGNKYPDLVVGAYESNTVAFFRSRPVINMYSTINFISPTISLNNKACVLSDGAAVACSELKVCCVYSGQGSWPQHEFTLHVILDEKKKTNPRLFFLDFENKNSLNWTVQIQKDLMYCRQMKVYVSQYLRDKLTTLDAEVQIEMSKDSNQLSNSWRKRDPKRKLMAVLGPKDIKKRDALIIQKNCGSDNICTPDLSIQVRKNVEKYLLGSKELLNLDVSIRNAGEDAFEATFYLQLPPGIDYVKKENDKGSNEVIVQCSPPKTSNNNTLRCDVGNPLPGGKIVTFKIVLQPITSDGMKPSYDFNMKVNSTNTEQSYTIRDNEINLSVPVWVETSILVEGESRPQKIDFNSVDFVNVDPESLSKLEHGPNMTHNYTIKNNGQSTILNISTALIWTAELFTGGPLVYLLEQPEVSDENKIYCKTANFDYLNINGPRKPRDIRNRYSHLESLTTALFTDPILDYDESRSKRQVSYNPSPQDSGKREPLNGH